MRPLSRLGGAVTRVLAIFGFVAVIGVGMWGSIRIASGVPGAFSSLAAAFVSLTSVFVPANVPSLILSAPSQTQASGTAFVLSWTEPKDNPAGSYTLRYDCADGVYFTSPSASGTPTNVYCNVPFNFINANDSLTLTPFSTKDRTADVTAYIDFTPNGATRPTVTGRIPITVENDALSGGAAPSAPAAQPSQPAAPVAPTAGPATTQTFPLGSTTPALPSNPNGSVDLAARIIAVGVTDRTTGAFTASSTPSIAMTTGAGQYRIAVRFAVENDGTKTSPQFNFNAVLPTLPEYIFVSPPQQALAPGDRIEFTLGFDEFDPSSDHVFTVNVDPSGSINEQNKANNVIHYTVPTTP